MTTPIFDQLAATYGTDNLLGFKAELDLDDWYHDRGYGIDTLEYNN